MVDGGEGEDGSKRRVLRVLSLLRQFGEPELWRHVRDDILKDGELDVSDVMHSAKLPDLTFLLASGAATYVTCLNLRLTPALYGATMSALSDSLLLLPQLEELKLDANYISDNGAMRLTQAVTPLPRLERLWLANNYLTEVGVRGVRRAAASTPRVWLVILDWQRPPGQELDHLDDVVDWQRRVDQLYAALSRLQRRRLADRDTSNNFF
ncbi:hypothetical protein LSAT2_019718 [Lamellibrachia satsuma]|nr:hypothetical protein LSAT2_019718 [Lamellibrachia satsuma]